MVKILKIKKIWKSAIVLPLLFLVTCSFAKAPERNYYIINYKPSQVIPSTSGRPYPYALQIEGFDVQRLFNRQNIVYRYSPEKIQYYEMQQWAVRPEYMITDMVLKHMEASRLFNRVGIDFFDSRPDYRLQGSVEAIEKYDSGDVFFAHLAMSLKLVNATTGSQIWFYSFDQRKQIFHEDMVYTVIGLSSILQTQMDVVVGQLDSLLFRTQNPSASPSEVPQTIAPSQEPAPSEAKQSEKDIDESQFEIIPEKNIDRKPK